MLQAWWQTLQTWRAKRRQAKLAQISDRRAIDDSLWQECIVGLPFISHLPSADLARLRQMVSLFLDHKEFSGAKGFELTDRHAVMVALQACLPILYIAPPDRPDLALAWYESFVGIVLHAGEVKTRREWVDEDGIAHSAQEQITGEIIEGGPLMLAWSDVQAAGELADMAYNVVIHEFIHVMDLRDGGADGCPPMPAPERRQWRSVLQAEYAQFLEASQAWQRFGAFSGLPEPVIDPYGAESLCEFFAVAAEAYFVQRQRFAQGYPQLLRIFDGFFRAYASY